ncbi:MAG: hypothetical protein IKW74_06935, partial [Thermoguttaceae bacterium]|nr:hypothetical protein [Thermoguttaceae bacterium]
GTVVLADSTILSNKAGMYGGGICNQENFYLSESTVAENQTKNQGAGIYNSISGVLGVYDSIIYKNSPKDPGYNFQGGGIYNDGETTARNCLFEENRGMYGAGMYNSYSGTSTVNNSVFWGNEATEEGGAVYTVGALTVTDSSIQKNVAPTDVTSAGIYVHPNVRIQPVVSGTTITDNQTSADVYQATRFLTLRNEDGDYLNGLFSSGMLANNDTTAAILKKTYTITNIYEKAVTLSGLSVSGVNYTNGFAYTIHDSDGKTVSATTVLEPGDSLYLDLTLKASITGTKFIQFRWNATTEDVTDEYFTFATAFNVADSLTQGTTGGVVVSFDGTTASCSISLKSRPTSRVLVYLQPDNGLELSQSLFIFDSSNFSIAQSTTVSATKVDIGLDPDYQKLISWHVLTDDPTYLGTSIRNTLVTLENYLTVEKGGMVNLTSYSAFPASWDLNGDGYYEVRTDGKTPVWISESGFSSSVISYKESVNGTESDVLYMDVVKLETAPVITSALTVSDAVSQLAFLHLDIMTVSGVPVQSCRINWGDGSAPQYIEGAVSALDLNHYYLTGGDYAVSVEVVDASGYGANLFYQIGELTVSKAVSA